MNSESYSSLKSDHDAIRGHLTQEQNDELDGLRTNGAQWDKLGYAAGAVILALVGFLFIFA